MKILLWSLLFFVRTLIQLLHSIPALMDIKDTISVSIHPAEEQLYLCTREITPKAILGFRGQSEDETSDTISFIKKTLRKMLKW